MEKRLFEIVNEIHFQGIDNSTWGIDKLIEVKTDWFFGTDEEDELNGHYIWIYAKVDDEVTTKRLIQLNPNKIYKIENERLYIYKV